MRLFTWLFRLIGVSLLGTIAFGVWFAWPILIGKSASSKPELGVTALAEPLKPGCSVNAELRIDLRHENLTAANGERAVASVMKARNGCDDLDHPLVAFNWFTLTDWWSTIRFYRYQMFAVQKVANVAKVQSVVFLGRGPTILSQPESPGPASGAAWHQPWVHRSATMPYYPSAKSILHMVDASRDSYFEQIAAKHAAIGESGYFGMQTCLVNCEALLAPAPPSFLSTISIIPDAKVRAPVLIHHMNTSRETLDAFLVAMQAALAKNGKVTMAYAGWTTADAFTETESGKLIPILQKPLWQDATIMYSPTTAMTGDELAAIVAAQAPQQDFLRTATNNVLLLY